MSHHKSMACYKYCHITYLQVLEKIVPDERRIVLQNFNVFNTSKLLWKEVGRCQERCQDVLASRQSYSSGWAAVHVLKPDDILCAQADQLCHGFTIEQDDSLCNASGIVLFRIINLTMKSIQAGTIEKIPGKIMVKPSQEIILVVRTTNVTACRGKFMCSLWNDREFVPQTLQGGELEDVCSLFLLMIFFQAFHIHRIAELQNGLNWRSSCSTLLFKWSHLQQVVHDCVWMAFEYSRIMKAPQLSGEPIPVLSHTHSKNVLSDIQTTPSVFQFVPKASGSGTGHYWKSLASSFLHPPFRHLYTSVRFPPGPSPL